MPQSSCTQLPRGTRSNHVLIPTEVGGSRYPDPTEKHKPRGRLRHCQSWPVFRVQVTASESHVLAPTNPHKFVNAPINGRPNKPIDNFFSDSPRPELPHLLYIVSPNRSALPQELYLKLCITRHESLFVGIRITVY